MAKKRTLQPYYGKRNQWLEAAATRAAKASNFEQAALLFGKSKDIIKKRKASA